MSTSITFYRRLSRAFVSFLHEKERENIEDKIFRGAHVATLSLIKSDIRKGDII